MPTSYFPPEHDKQPPVPASPTSPPFSRSTSLQLAPSTTPLLPPSQQHHTRRRSSALSDLDDQVIKLKSQRAKEAEERAQWEHKLNNTTTTTAIPPLPPITPPRHSSQRRPLYPRGDTTTSSSSIRSVASPTSSPSNASLYETPTGQPGYSLFPLPPTNNSSSSSNRYNNNNNNNGRSPRSPRSREPSSSMRSISSSSSSSQLNEVVEFLQDQEPPPPPPRISLSSSSQQQPSIRNDRKSPLNRSRSISSSNSTTSSSSFRNRNHNIFPTTATTTAMTRNQQQPPRNSTSSSSSSFYRTSPYDKSTESLSLEDEDEDVQEEEEEASISELFSPRLKKNFDLSSPDPIVREIEATVSRRSEKNKDKNSMRVDHEEEGIRGEGDREGRWTKRDRMNSEFNGEGGERGRDNDHSRTESSTSDASFASMTALPTNLNQPTTLVNGQVQKEEEEGMLMSSGMERDDTLRPSLLQTQASTTSTSSRSNSWMNGYSLSSGNFAGEKKSKDHEGPTMALKSMDELLKGYKALEVGSGGGLEGVLARRRSSVMTTSPTTTTNSNPPPTTTLSPVSTTLSPSIYRRDDPESREEYEPLEIPSPQDGPLPYVPFPTTTNSTTLTASGSRSTISTTGDGMTTGKIKTIEEIIAQHAGPSYLNRTTTTTTTTNGESPTNSMFSTSTATKGENRRMRETSSSTTATMDSRDSIDSVGAEAMALHSRVPSRQDSTPRHRNSSLYSSSNIGGGRQTPTLVLDPSAVDRQSTRSSTRSTSLNSPSPRIHSPVRDFNLPSPTTTSSSPVSASQELTQLLRSPRLTRLITLSRPSNLGVTVSLADVGSPTGRPVVIFLGLGAVRYLLALYDELAETFNLRLICIDRWGMGRTTPVPDQQRSFERWSLVVEEVLIDHLGLEEYSILAHSAGGPYAVISALRSSRSGNSTVHGSIHLLSPWVSSNHNNNESTTDGGGIAPRGEESLTGYYKYLKYVPLGVIKAGQAAEWRIQGWKLGKGPGGIEESSNDWDGELVDEENEDGFVQRELSELKATTPTRSSRRTPSMSGRSLLGGLLRSAKEGKSSASSNRSISSSDRPSLSPVGTGSNRVGSGRRSSYFAATAIANSNRSTPPPPLQPSGLTMPMTPTSASSSHSRNSLVPSPRSPSPASSLTPYPPRSASSTSLRPLSPSTLLSPTSSTFTTSSTTSGITPRSPSPRPSISPELLISGLLRASHAESLPGSTSDLMILLQRGEGKNSLTPIPYEEVEVPVKVWYGDRDDRISEQSVRWMQKRLKNCELKIVKGADHSLMTNHRVMFEVLESISREWEQPF